MKNLFVGIDFSKEKVCAAAISAKNQNGTSTPEYNEFDNSASGFGELIKWVETIAVSTDFSKWIFCCKDAGNSSKHLCKYLFGKGCDVWLETANSIKDALTSIGQNSDCLDARMIAEYAKSNYGKAVMYDSNSASLSELRQTYLDRQLIVQQLRNLQAYRDEKELTMKDSPAKKMILKESSKLISEYIRSLRLLDEDIATFIADDKELRAVYAS